MYDDFDRDTRRAVLRLYRATDAAASAQELSAALRPLDRPALVLWGAHDTLTCRSPRRSSNDAPSPVHR